MEPKNGEANIPTMMINHLWKGQSKQIAATPIIP